MVVRILCATTEYSCCVSVWFGSSLQDFSVRVFDEDFGEGTDDQVLPTSSYTDAVLVNETNS